MTASAIRSLRSGQRSLEHWLQHLERIHPRTIAMGLERVSQVRQSMGLNPKFPIITVAGTNGKGSACAMLEAIFHAAGYRVGIYTSPHLLQYNERVRVGRHNVTDAALCAAFQQVEQARGDTLLTYFEFATLAAMQVLIERQVEVAILEVGLGGRLDAVNVFDPLCALIMSIDIDHQDYLGLTRESIGREKAGILRAGKSAVCADPDPPLSVIEHARILQVPLKISGRDFHFSADKQQWQWSSAAVKRAGLPLPALRGSYQVANAAACLALLDEVREQLPVDMGAIRRGLLDIDLAGRFQLLPGRPQVILDVAHNPHAARGLRASLQAMPRSGKVRAVFAMLRDKDMVGTARELKDEIDQWHVSGIATARGASAEEIRGALRSAEVTAPVIEYADPAAAYRAAVSGAGQDDRILVFGSFHTVAAVRRQTK